MSVTMAMMRRSTKLQREVRRRRASRPREFRDNRRVIVAGRAGSSTSCECSEGRVRLRHARRARRPSITCTIPTPRDRFGVVYVPAEHDDRRARLSSRRS